MNHYILISFFLYFSLLLFAGILYHKKQTTVASYIMGNRSLNFWLVALSAHASDMSSWLFMAFPPSIFLLGLSQAWVALGLIIGMFLNWQFVAPRLRAMTEIYNCYTLSSFFEKRFKDDSGILRVISALVMVIFLTYYLSAGLIAMGNLLESLFDLNYLIGITVALVVMVIYTFIGGFNTVALIDLLQGIFLLIVLLLVPTMGYNYIGGWDTISFVAQQRHMPLSFTTGEDFHSILATLSLALGWGLGYFGMPHIITKFMGIKHTSELNKSKWLGMSWQLLTLSASICVGIVAIGFFPEGLPNPELAFVEIVKTLFHPFVAGFILCAIIAANLSTMDSQILVCGSLMGEDLYLPLKKVRPSDRKVLWFSKFSVLFVSLIALALASNRSTTIMDTVFYAWSGLGSAFGPIVLLSLYSRSINKQGALAGIVVGTAVAMIWPTANLWLTDFVIAPMIPGFLMSGIAIYVVSYITRHSTPYPEVRFS